MQRRGGAAEATWRIERGLYFEAVPKKSVISWTCLLE